MYCLLLYLFQFFEHSKSIMIYKSRNLWNSDSFLNFILSFQKFAYNFRNFMIYEIVKSGNCLEFFELEIFVHS